jgi:hypothetical protein
MDEKSIQKYGEIQYLKGRLDELYKQYPNVMDIHESRLMDQRIQKYFEKLKSVDEISYHLYLVELHTRRVSKEKSKNNIKELLEQVISEIDNKDLIEKVISQINRY